jgi:hypothetical protein
MLSAVTRDRPPRKAWRRRLRGLVALVGLVLAGLLLPAAASAALNVFRGLNLPGLAARDNQSLAEPPDPTGAVSRDHYIEVVNARIAVFERVTLRRVAELDARAFWRAGFTGLMDPQIAWDDRARRWYLVMLRSGGDSPNALLFAWSKTSDPTDLNQGWCKLEVPSGRGSVDDFPKLGFSRRHVLIGTNVGRKGKVVFSRIWVIGKPRAVAGGCDRPPIRSFGNARHKLRDAAGAQAATPVPVVPVGNADRGYVVAAACVADPGADPNDPEEETGCSRAGKLLTVWHVTGPRGRPRLVRDGGIGVRAFRLPRAVPQRGTNRLLDASDTRLVQAVSNRDPRRGGRRLIWTQHTVAGRRHGSEVRWYALDPRRLAIVARGSVRKRRRWVFNAAISPTTKGDAAIINYNVGGSRLLPQLRARVAGRPNSEILLARSVAPHKICDPPPEDPYCRWGDYAGAVPDPIEPNVVWGSNELAGLPSESDPIGWRTRNFALTTR